MFIEIGSDLAGQIGAIPADVERLLAPTLTYTHRHFLQGADRIGPDGSIRRVEFETRRLYDLSPRYTLLTGFGCLPRLMGLLHAAGHPVRIVDCSPPKPRPKAYTVDWDLFNRKVAEKKWVWRHRQLECICNLTTAYGGIINAPPAFGKTEIIAWLAILFPWAKIAVVTKRADVAKTIVRRLKAYLPNVGFCGGGKRPKGERVTVYIAKSMTKCDGDVDFCFYDEAHESCSDWYAEQFTRTFIHSRNFGFTATPDGRADGGSPRLEYMFGPQIFFMPWQEAEAHGMIVPVEVRWLNITLPRDPTAGYTSDVAKKRWGLWRNDPRNAAFGYALTHGHEFDDQALCLVETIDHAVHLRKHLPHYELCYDKMDPGFLEYAKANDLLPEDYEPLTPKQRDALRSGFEDGRVRRVIATDVWSTGVSFDALAILARLCGRSSEILDDQAPGRVTRTHAPSGKASAIMYDAHDLWNPGAERRSKERYKRYGNKGWTQLRDYMAAADPRSKA
jgi:superfamily II DNA or RNA helicase